MACGKTYVADGVGLGVDGKVVKPDCAGFAWGGLGAVDDLLGSGDDMVVGGELLVISLALPVVPSGSSGSDGDEASDNEGCLHADGCGDDVSNDSWMD